MRRIAPLPLLLAAVLALAAPAVAPAADQQTLSVVGQGRAHARPDLADVVVSLRRRDPSAVAARTSVSRRATRIIDAASGLGVPREDIQTNVIELRRRVLRPLHKGGRQRIRYDATTTVSFRFTRIDRVGPFLNAATSLGANDIQGPSFSFTTPAPGRAEAEQAALADARARADAAAALLGMKVVGVRSIDLNPDTFTATPAPEQSAAGTTAPAPKKVTPPATTPVEPGSEDVDAIVAVVFLIAPA